MYTYTFLMVVIDGAIVFDGMDNSFRKIILSKENRPMVVSALNMINGRDISPRQEDIFAFAKWPTDDVKIVIIGQEPNNKIYSKLIDKIPIGNNFISWARQGVLFVNIALTSEVNKIDAHIRYWKPLTSAIISYFGSLERPICFMLWGDYAKKMRPLIKNGLVLEYSQNTEFEKCNHFSRANQYLIENNISPIDWNVDGHIELRISVNESGRTKYTKKIVAHCEIFLNEKLIANLSQNVSAEVDFSGGQILFPTAERGIECAKKLGLLYVKTIGYLSIEINRVQ